MTRLRRGSGIFLGMLWLLIADVATAGDYALVMGKAAAVCQHMLKIFNEDMKTFGELQYGQHEEFTVIDWTLALEDYCRRDQLAQFDIDNDGDDDTVLKHQGCLRSTLSDNLYIYAEGKNAPVPPPKFLFDAAMAKQASGVIWKSRDGLYELRKLPKFREGTFEAYHYIGAWRGFRINPFRFGGQYYVVLDNPFQVLKNGRRFTAIAKYEKNGQLNDVCYLSTTIRRALDATD